VQSKPPACLLFTSGTIERSFRPFQLRPGDRKVQVERDRSIKSRGATVKFRLPATRGGLAYRRDISRCSVGVRGQSTLWSSTFLMTADESRQGEQSTTIPRWSERERRRPTIDRSLCKSAARIARHLLTARRRGRAETRINRTPTPTGTSGFAFARLSVSVFECLFFDRRDVTVRAVYASEDDTSGITRYRGLATLMNVSVFLLNANDKCGDNARLASALVSILIGDNDFPGFPTSTTRQRD
jgi:hypothetical protein